MSRLLTTGYETGDVNEAGASTTGANVTITAVSTSPVPRGGSYCLKIAASQASFNASYKTYALSALKTDIWARFAVFIHSLGATGEWQIAQVQDSAASAQNSLSWDASSQVLRVRLGNFTSGALLGVSATTFPPDTWHVIDWRTQITSASAGVSEVWLDGNQVINFSGDNSNTAVVGTQFLLLGSIAGTFNVGSSGGYLAYDDIGINDTAGTVNNGRIGDGRVVLLSPTGAGSSTQLTRGGTDTGANWSQVSEVPPSMAQYVGSATLGQRDLYAMSDLGVTPSSINVVEAICLAQNSDAGGGNVAPTVKSGSTTSEGSPLGLSTSAGYVVSRWETDPNTAGLAWTQTTVNAVEAGATIR